MFIMKAIPCVAALHTITASSSFRCRQSVLHKLYSTSRIDNVIAKLLVANRGEIAARVLTTAKKLGIPSVAVFSDCDRKSVHVALADERYFIGPSPARESYLQGQHIVNVAKQCGATAIHPGYGFLSENAAFAELCDAEGITFVGPPASAMRAMGDKSRAKEIMATAGVPVVPGYHGAEQDMEGLLTEAEAIGYPLLVKAVSGGGGKGMKIAWRSQEVQQAIESAKREGRSSFNDDRVLLERYITRPRHVEVQVMADTQGNTIYLFDRDCSVQRRHQKIMEEAPAPGLTAEFHQCIGDAAVRAAKAVGYVGAGTVEFIVDVDTNIFYFMEMNTRLQVEHPVTEAITGQDLVEWQLRVAAGEKLPLTQEELRCTGHAFEARLYAESPRKNFLPGAGQVSRWRTPSSACAFNVYGEVRIDSGVREGDVVGNFYDPMIAKVVTRGGDRTTALARMRETLAQIQVGGLPTNLHFLQSLAAHPAFLQGEDLDTAFIQKHGEQLLKAHEAPGYVAAMALVARAKLIQIQQQACGGGGSSGGPWGIDDGKRLWHTLVMDQRVHEEEANQEHDWKLEYVQEEKFKVHLGRGSQPVVVDHVEFLMDLPTSAGTAPGTHISGHIKGVVDEKGVEADVMMYRHLRDDVLDIWAEGEGRSHKFRWSIPQWSSSAQVTASHGQVTSPMPGKLVKLMVKAGDRVAKGDPLLVMEAMKMEHTVVAPMTGQVVSLSLVEGSQVEDGQVLVDLDE